MITITVNCVGVMGAGLALTAAQRHPGLVESYRQLLYDGELHVGRVATSHGLLLFPTKLHWREPSKLWYISAGLKDLQRRRDELGIEHLQIPPLGCGLGKLKWNEVKPLIHEYLDGYIPWTPLENY